MPRDSLESAASNFGSAVEDLSSAAEPFKSATIEGCVNIILEAINTDDQHLQLYLDTIPLKTANVAEYDEILVFFLESALENRNGGAANIIMRRWESSNPMETSYPLRSLIYLNTGVNAETLRFVESNSPVTNDYFTHLRVLLEYGDNPRTKSACVLLDKVFGDQDPARLSLFMDEINTNIEGYRYDNQTIIDHIKNKYSEVSDYAPIPSWIVEYESVANVSNSELLDILNDNLESIHAPFELPTPEEGCKLILKTLGAIDIGEEFGLIPDDDVVTITDTFRQTLESSSLEERRKLLEPIIRRGREYDQHTSILAFQILGPAHPITGRSDLDSTSSDPCARWGGCRMMTCWERENIDDEGYEIDPDGHNYSALDWFSGICDMCARKIRERHHAVRMPFEDGGWEGCYCSWACTRGDIDGQPEVRNLLIDRFEVQFHERGILDRVWDEPEKMQNVEITLEEFKAADVKYSRAFRAMIVTPITIRDYE